MLVDVFALLVVLLGVTAVSFLASKSVAAGFFFDGVKSPGRSKVTVELFGNFFERDVFSSLADFLYVLGLVNEGAAGRKRKDNFK